MVRTRSYRRFLGDSGIADNIFHNLNFRKFLCLRSRIMGEGIFADGLERGSRRLLLEAVSFISVN